MPLKAPNLLFALRLLMPCILLPLGAAAQTATLSGTATDAKGKPIANASVSITAAAGTGSVSVNVRTDGDGNYSIPNLAPGDYSISASGEGLSSKTIKVTITNVAHQTLDLLLTAAPEQQKRAQELPNAPTSAPPPAPASPSLEDLGFPSQQTQANAQLQATLEKRTHMLKIHQTLGLITTIPMTAAVITGPMAKAKGKNGETIKEPTTANLDVHAALGGVTTALYFTSAYFAIAAPRVPGNKKHGGIRWHEALAFVHGPGMILTPILGVMAYNQENNGEKPSGIASQHGTVAYITAAAYGAAIVAVSWPIHWKFWEKK
jgi:Carboxypeptidase regulatory-like domain